MPKRTHAVVPPSLDLHGMRRERALRAVTDFFEAQKHHCVVVVITGSGSHSNDGPVLRVAVEKLLKKRQMEFERDTPGSFKVNPSSGIELFLQEQQQGIDTKVILQSAEDEVVAAHRAAQRKKHYYSKGSSSSSSDTPAMSNMLISGGPALVEVATEERLLEQARLQSLEQVKEEAKLSRQEREKLKQAVELSKLEEEHHRKQEEREREMMQRALEQSEKDAFEMQKEEEELQRIFEESKRAALSEEEAIQEAIRASLEDQTTSPEDALLQEALALSLH